MGLWITAGSDTGGRKRWETESGHNKMLSFWMKWVVWEEKKSFQDWIILGGVYHLLLKRMHHRVRVHLYVSITVAVWKRCGAQPKVNRKWEVQQGHKGLKSECLWGTEQAGRWVRKGWDSTSRWTGRMEELVDENHLCNEVRWSASASSSHHELSSHCSSQGFFLVLFVIFFITAPTHVATFGLKFTVS